MVLPKVLSPSFWVDKCLTLVLQLVLALLLQILYILKGEDVRVTDVKVTVRKAIPSDRKSIIQSPAKATRPARQNITVKAGPNAAPGESTREIKAPIIASKKPSEEHIITGTLTELKPDKIEKIEAKAEISTSTATPIIETETVTFEVEKSEDVEVKAEELVKVQAEKIEPEVKGNEAKTSEPVEVIFGEPEVPEIISEVILDEPIEIKAGEPEVSEIISGMVKEGIVSKMAEESSKIISEPVKVIPEPKANEVEVSETVSKTVEQMVEGVISKMAEESSGPVKVIPEVKADESEVIPKLKADEAKVSIDKDKDTAKTGITQLPPEMKTSHDITHSDSDIEIVAFQWNKHGNKVSVRGSSDNWKVDHEMQPDYINGGFVAFIPIDRTKNYEFKFVIDDEHWEIDHDLKTEYDECGNRNNVIPAFASDQLSQEYKNFPGILTSHQLAAAH